MEKDLSCIIEGWDYDPDDFLNNVRKIIGKDCQERIQLRTDLGVYQMETTGRPDGKRPGGNESLLAYYLAKAQEQQIKFGAEGNIKLNEQDIANLYRESLQYYHRRICLFTLKEFELARKDAEHTLMIMDLVKKYSISKLAVFHFEQYRPYMIGEKTRAIGLHLLERKDYTREDFVNKCQQIRFLKQWQKQLRKEWENDTSMLSTTELSLEEQLEIAIRQENYEEAARLRDMLKGQKERSN